MKNYTKINEYAYPWDDEIMAECRARKAEVSSEMKDWSTYSNHLKEDRIRLEAEGWKFINKPAV